MTKIRLNGKEIEADEDATVLDVAMQEGLDIPALCRHEALAPYGACRLCIVEAEGPALRRSLLTSCNLKTFDGMSVETESPRVKSSRKVLFELLLGRSPDSKPLKEMAKRFGVESTRFATDRSDDCARCGLCVRACQDRIGLSAITFAGRGQKRRVTAEIGKLSETCIGCGACANICPTGAIKLEDNGNERKIFLHDTVISALALAGCESCRKPYATLKLLDYVAAHPDNKYGLNIKLKLCPACTRKHYAGEHSKILLSYSRTNPD